MRRPGKSYGSPTWPSPRRPHRSLIKARTENSTWQFWQRPEMAGEPITRAGAYTFQPALGGGSDKVRYAHRWEVHPETTEIRLIVRDRLTSRCGAIEIQVKQ